MRCSVCKNAYYCDRVCQARDRVWHKVYCKTPEERRAQEEVERGRMNGDGRRKESRGKTWEKPVLRTLPPDPVHVWSVYLGLVRRLQCRPARDMRRLLWEYYSADMCSLCRPNRYKLTTRDWSIKRPFEAPVKMPLMRVSFIGRLEYVRHIVYTNDSRLAQKIQLWEHSADVSVARNGGGGTSSQSPLLSCVRRHEGGWLMCLRGKRFPDTAKFHVLSTPFVAGGVTFIRAGKMTQDAGVKVLVLHLVPGLRGKK